ncbi:MAG: SLBB domain-containing protein [Bacteroidia bacterium]|jgi:protein involved in polysaccharide export with SLBB domain
MKKLLALVAIGFLTAVGVNAQFIMPSFTDSTLFSDEEEKIDTPQIIKELAPQPVPVEKEENPQEVAEVRKLELQAQRLKLEKEIAALSEKAERTPEEEEVLRLKNENLKLVSLKEKLLLEKEYADMQKSQTAQTYPSAAIYGQQFFRDGTFKLYQKSDEVVATENYILGSGDIVQLEVWGYRYWSRSYTVSESGSIDISGYQKVFVKGLTLKQAKSMIGSRLGISGNESSYSVTVTRPRMVSVTILGEVFTPGSYSFPATNNAFNALASMGGPSNIGSVRNIYIKRDGKIRDSLDVYEYFHDIAHQRDVFLQNNDYIIVMPAKTTITISGGVRRPGTYEVKAGEGILDLLNFAGGTLPNTYFNDIIVTRIRDNKFETISVNLDSLKKIKKDFLLDGGETIQLKTITPDNDYVAEIQGAISVPGSYKIREGMRLSALIKNANGLTTQAYLERAFLVRTNKDLTQTYIPFSPIDVIQKKGTEADVMLQNQDRILIFNKTELQQFSNIKLDGAVFKPLNIAYIKGLKLGEFLFMAGGITQEADSSRGFIIRTNTDFKKVLIPFVPGEILGKGAMYDFEIMPKDEITIYSKTAFIRRYNMEIQGPVKAPVNTEFTQGTRLSDLLNLAGGLEESAFRKRALIMHQDIKTGIRTAQTVNLEEVIKNPGSEADILIQRNDIVRVFSLTELKTDFTVSVYGEVRKNGEYSYADNMTMQNLIDLAGGLEFVSAGTQIEIVRNLKLENGFYSFVKPFVIFTTITDNLNLEEGIQSLELQPFDRVFIRRNPNFIPLKLIYIDGAVLYPGYYALQGENEKLNSLIKRAGGFRPDAQISGMSIKRTLKSGEAVDVVPNAIKAMKRKRSHYNLILKGGDNIYVPFTESLVLIKGDMNNSGKIIGAYYDRGKRAKYYIRNYGGGFTRTSDRKNVVVVHSNGARVGTHRYILFRVYPKVFEGSTIEVISKVETGGGSRGGGRNRLDIDATLNKFMTRATAILSIIGLYRVATAR